MTQPTFQPVVLKVLPPLEMETVRSARAGKGRDGTCGDAEGQVLVDLVGHDDRVVAVREFDGELEELAIEHDPGGVVRGVEQDDAGAVGDRGTQLVGVGPEVGGRSGTATCRRSGQADQRGVGVVERLERDDLVTLVDEREQGRGDAPRSRPRSRAPRARDRRRGRRSDAGGRRSRRAADRMPRPGGYWLAPSAIACRAASSTSGWTVLVGEALTEVDRAGARGQGGHLSEDRRTQLARVAQQPGAAGGALPGSWNRHRATVSPSVERHPGHPRVCPIVCACESGHVSASGCCSWRSRGAPRAIRRCCRRRLRPVEPMFASDEEALAAAEEAYAAYLAMSDQISDERRGRLVRLGDRVTRGSLLNDLDGARDSRRSWLRQVGTTLFESQPSAVVGVNGGRAGTVYVCMRCLGGRRSRCRTGGQSSRSREPRLRSNWTQRCQRTRSHGDRSEVWSGHGRSVRSSVALPGAGLPTCARRSGCAAREAAAHGLCIVRGDRGEEAVLTGTAGSAGSGGSSGVAAASGAAAEAPNCRDPRDHRVEPVPRRADAAVRR